MRFKEEGDKVISLALAEREEESTDPGEIVENPQETAPAENQEPDAPVE